MAYYNDLLHKSNNALEAEEQGYLKLSELKTNHCPIQGHLKSFKAFLKTIRIDYANCRVHHTGTRYARTRYFKPDYLKSTECLEDFKTFLAKQKDQDQDQEKIEVFQFIDFLGGSFGRYGKKNPTPYLTLIRVKHISRAKCVIVEALQAKEPTYKGHKVLHKNEFEPVPHLKGKNKITSKLQPLEDHYKGFI